MKVLVTASTGLTGKAVVKSLVEKDSDIEVKAMVHTVQKAEEMLRLGASVISVTDIASEDELEIAMRGIDVVYYICPTAREDEAKIGKKAISAAKKAGVRRFVYQSVLHSIEPELPHHRQKLEVERALIDSGLCYTIVQPAPFMQNLLNAKDALINNHVFVQKFFTGMDSANRINLIDASDFGRCVAEIITDNQYQYQYATLELCGPENLSVSEMLVAMEKVLGAKVGLKYISDDDLIKSMSARNVPQYSIDTLLQMFRHYNGGDFCGSDFVTSAILKRQPTNIAEFLKRELL